MRKMDLGRLVGLIGLLAAATIAALPACSSAAGNESPTPTAPQATSTPVATPTPAPTATSKPEATDPAATASSEASEDVELLALGSTLFVVSAGGTGCAVCHGYDAKGGRTTGQAGAPDIRGVGKGGIRGALAGGVPDMAHIDLTEHELTAVAAYISYLSVH